MNWWMMNWWWIFRLISYDCTALEVTREILAEIASYAWSWHELLVNGAHIWNFFAHNLDRDGNCSNSFEQHRSFRNTRNSLTKTRVTIVRCHAVQFISTRSYVICLEAQKRALAFVVTIEYIQTRFHRNPTAKDFAYTHTGWRVWQADTRTRERNVFICVNKQDKRVSVFIAISHSTARASE